PPLPHRARRGAAEPGRVCRDDADLVAPRGTKQQPYPLRATRLLPRVSSTWRRCRSLGYRTTGGAGDVAVHDRRVRFAVAPTRLGRLPEASIGVACAGARAQSRDVEAGGEGGHLQVARFSVTFPGTWR